MGYYKGITGSGISYEVINEPENNIREEVIITSVDGDEWFDPDDYMDEVIQDIEYKRNTDEYS